jgi:hypothetical protein
MDRALLRKEPLMDLKIQVASSIAEYIAQSCAEIIKKPPN